MTELEYIVDIELLNQMVAEGYIREQAHPEFPELRILNYAEKTQFERNWNAATRMCRGLIYNADTREVLARPFPKIHNWNEAEAPRVMDDQTLYSYSNKYDGSLGIGYITPDGDVAIATRGSFASDQAQWANSVLTLFPGLEDTIYNAVTERAETPLFEIIYPENRIVIDYGDMEALIPLGFIAMVSGTYYSADDNAPQSPRSLRTLLMDVERVNAEGWVAWLNPTTAVKIKQADYVELHRIVTGLNRKSIWRAMRDETYDEMLPRFPDELYKWAESVREDLDAQYRTIGVAAYKYYNEVLMSFPSAPRIQKEFALAVQSKVPAEYRGMVFALGAGKAIHDTIFKMIEPKGGDR